MELSKNYDPSLIEQKWSEHWKAKKYFNSVPDDRPPFTVVIPPPNVTGVLHMGHTLNETVQDILVRKARMTGKNACWVPGSDHASIATEAKVVEMLRREKGIEKSQLTRQEFLAYAYEWKEKYGNIIYHQFDKLGCSVDWTRATFTMDRDYYEAVIKVFVELYQKGLIYRGARMIHWDPVAKTALSDEEVEYRDIESKLYYIKYRIADQQSRLTDEYITIATQRPETIMGDTAVCVNPDDERFSHLKGMSVIIPLVNRSVPLIFDSYVDAAFGTGALKVTPAHDLNDYNLSLKHQLEIINILNEDGTISEAAQVFVGKDRFTARQLVVEALREQGLIVKEENYQTRLGYSQRSNAVVEPRISTQWFLAMETLAKKALKEVERGNIRIHPHERFFNTYKYWLENIKDWCISRQLWWGQQIPAWYDKQGNFVVAASKEEAIAAFEQRGLTADKDSIHQDPDVLDTWFSSWLWPIQVFKGITQPDNADINYYYPTNVLVTGQDIIFFWVARMIMAGMEFKREKPFSDVYFTGMVRDKQGRKMSKSLGNSPDLLELIERNGADAVRFGIMISSPAGNDLLFDSSSPEQGRNFNNKIWNALKLVRSWKQKLSENGQQSVESEVSGFAGDDEPEESSATDVEFAITWFTNRLNQAKAQINGSMAAFSLSESLKTLYSLIWDDFCSWYLEWVKPGPDVRIDPRVHAATVQFFSELMQLLHPFMPFITEEVYHLLDERNTDLCVLQEQQVLPADENILTSGETVKQVISAIREAKIRNRIKSRDEIKLYIQTDSPDIFRSAHSILEKQLNANAIAFNTDPLGQTISVVVGKDKFFIETAVAIDHSHQKEALIRELEYLKGFLVSVNKKLSNQKFIENARPEVIAIEQKKRIDAEEKIRVLEESLERLDA
jgi:valyl-tRNA synthetase